MPATKYMTVPTTSDGATAATTDGGHSAESGTMDHTNDDGDLAVATMGGSINSGGGGGIKSTDSSQQLIGDSESAASTTSNSRQYNGNAGVLYSEWFAMFVLCFVNLINYMDRYTIAGKSEFLINYFKL